VVETAGDAAVETVADVATVAEAASVVPVSVHATSRSSQA
jgi:hypothetical protein